MSLWPDLEIAIDRWAGFASRSITGRRWPAWSPLRGRYRQSTPPARYFAGVMVTIAGYSGFGDDSCSFFPTLYFDCVIDVYFLVRPSPFLVTLYVLCMLSRTHMSSYPQNLGASG
jgi:hypothetical protein